MASPTFTPISCGQSYCGTSWIDRPDGNWQRDTDWYEITVPAGQTKDVSLTASAEFEFVVGVINSNGSGSCVDATAVDPGNTGGPLEEVSLEVQLQEGTWWIFVAPLPIDGGPNYVCGSGQNDYYLILECEEGGIFSDRFESAGNPSQVDKLLISMGIDTAFETHKSIYQSISAAQH